MPWSGVFSWFRQWRAKRDAVKYEQWCAFVQTRQWGADIFQIVSIRQNARTGQKAYACWLDTGETCAVWIPQAWPGAGVFVSASGDYGHGEHHNEQVFYVKRLFGVLDYAYYAAMRRHLARLDAPGHAMTKAVHHR